jgi:hypothetical protein
LTFRTLALPACILPFAACSSSSAPTQDASVHFDVSPSQETGTFDAGSYPDGECPTGTCFNVPLTTFTLDAGATWSALYRDYFGTTGVASCAGSGSECHGSPDSDAYVVSGYLCPPHDAGACYESFTSQSSTGSGFIVGDGGWGASPLPYILCQCNGMGYMPYACCYTFQAVDMQRIADWVNAGATNDYAPPPQPDAGDAASDAHEGEHDAGHDVEHDSGRDAEHDAEHEAGHDAGSGSHDSGAHDAPDGAHDAGTLDAGAAAKG